MPERRPRLRSFTYQGYYRYALTFCTHSRYPAFVDPSTVSPLLPLIRRTAEREAFSVLACCFMPDHLHLVVQGDRATSDLQRFVRWSKQATAHAYRRQSGRRLWQPSYYDRVLRDEEATSDVVKYVLENPLRAGLVKPGEEYPFVGSETWNP